MSNSPSILNGILAGGNGLTDNPPATINTPMAPAAPATAAPAVPLKGPGTPGYAAAPGTESTPYEDEGGDLAAASPLHDMATSFMDYLTKGPHSGTPQGEAKKAAAGSFADKLGRALSALGQDAAAGAAAGGGNRGALTGALGTLGARGERLTKEKQQQFENQERLKNDEINIARSNMEMRVHALALQQADEQHRHGNAEASSKWVDMYRKGYTVHDNITDDQLNEFVKKDPDYKRTHTAVITGYQPVIGADGKQKEIDGKLVEQPLWSIIDMKPGSGEPVTLDADSAKRLKSAGLGDYQAGQILPGTVAREQLGQADKIHTALGFISEQKLSEIPNDVKDRLATVVGNPEVFHALSMFKGNPIGGLHVAQQVLAKEADDLTAQLNQIKSMNGGAGPQGPGVQESLDGLQKKIDSVKSDAAAVDKVMTLGFDDKEKAEYWKEQDAAKKEEEAAEERARTQAETERHNRATEIFKAAEAGSPEQLNEAATMLADGEQDTSQLSKRAKSYQATINEANKVSWEKYGKPWSPADSQTEYKYANQKSTQDTLKMIDGMTDPGGAFDIALAAARQLPGLDQQTVNKLFNYGATEFGNKAQTDFHTAMVGFADEYSKVMGGGNPTDTLRKQGMDLMKDAYSKGQLEGAATVLKKDLAARQKAIVKNNRFLQRQVYGPQGMMVTMISPNGHRAEIPVSQRDAAIAAGAHVQTKAEYDQFLATQPKQ